MDWGNGASALFDKLKERPGGGELEPRPWDAVTAEPTQIPDGLKPPAPLGLRILLYGAGFFLLGFVLQAKAMIAFGLGLGAMVLGAQWRVRRLSGACELAQVAFPSHVTSGKRFDVTVTLRNTGSEPMDVAVHCVFDGSSRRAQVASARIEPGRETSLVFPYTADVGMGHFVLGPMDLVIRDPLALAPSVRTDLAFDVTVLPRVAAPDHFPFPPSGLPTHAGACFDRRNGDSVTFFGLRDFRQGDGIRKIDWKRSAHTSHLVVKQFESDLSADVTFFLDQSPQGHSEFLDISSLDAMKEAALSLLQLFLDRQQRVQVVAEEWQLPFGAGRTQSELASERIASLKYHRASQFPRLVTHHLPLVPPGSIACLFFTTASADPEALAESLCALQARRVETFLILFDSARFAARAARHARLATHEVKKLNVLWSPSALHDIEGLGRLIAGLPFRTFLLGPGETLAEACREWRQR